MKKFVTGACRCCFFTTRCARARPHGMPPKTPKKGSGPPDNNKSITDFFGRGKASAGGGASSSKAAHKNLGCQLIPAPAPDNANASDSRAATATTATTAAATEVTGLHDSGRETFASRHTEEYMLFDAFAADDDQEEQDPFAAVERMPLSEAQLAAATSDPNVPLMILAGAGTGKTTTLLGRIHFLAIDNNPRVPPEHILAMTFSAGPDTSIFSA